MSRHLSLILRPEPKRLSLGASQACSSCSRCIAEQMAYMMKGVEEYNTTVPLAPLIGTAVHALLEERARKLDMPGLHLEQRVKIHDIEGLCTVSGVCDIYDEQTRTVWDYKVLGKKHIKDFKANHRKLPDGRVVITSTRLLEYYIQVNLYGYGIKHDLRKPVDKVGLILLPRDATIDTEQDITELCFDYNEDIVKQCLTRLEDIHEYVKEFGTDDIDPDQDCFTCNYRR